MNRVAHYGRSGLMVSGPARTGKTTAITQLGKTAEVMQSRVKAPLQLGRALKDLAIPRELVVVATKVFNPMGPGPNDSGMSRRHIMQAVEASLTRLKTDYIDLYQAHWDDRETPLDETLRAFDDLVRYAHQLDYPLYPVYVNLATSDPAQAGVVAARAVAPGNCVSMIS